MKKILILLIICYNIVVTNAQNWTPVGTGMNSNVRAFTVYNGELYAGGDFTMAGGSSANRIAKWNEANWDTLGTGLIGGAVKSLSVYNSELNVCGSFNSAGGINVIGFAKWNGTSWNAVVSNGISSTPVYSLAVYNVELYIGGVNHGSGGSVYSSCIAKWNGTSLSSVGGGLNSSGSSFPTVFAFGTYNGELYTGGYFSEAGGISVNKIAKWNGLSWSSVGSGLNNIAYAFAEFNSELYVGGSFTIAGGDTVNYIARWNGTNWFPVGTGMNGAVRAFTVYNGELYAGGDFTMAGGSPANHISKWNGTSWSAVGAGIDTTVMALCVYNGSLYAGGAFTMSGSDTVRYIARLDTTTGIKQNFINNKVFVYPNPCTDKLGIEQACNSEMEISLFDISGKQIVKELKSSNKKTEIDMSRMETGVYFLKVKTGVGVFCRKIIKQ